MIGIVIVAHCGIADGFLAALRHVYGKDQDGVRAICVDSEYDSEAKTAEICAAADEVDVGAGVVMVTDLHGSSPFNLSCKACTCQSRRVISGASLPLVMKLAENRDAPLDDAVDIALKAGQKYMRCMQ